MKIGLGLLEPTKGSVVVDDLDIYNISKREKRNLRKTFQGVFQDTYSSLKSISVNI